MSLSLKYWDSVIGRLFKINLNKHIFLGISHKILGMPSCFFQDSRYAVTFFRYQIRPQIPYCDMYAADIALWGVIYQRCERFKVQNQCKIHLELYYEHMSNLRSHLDKNIRHTYDMQVISMGKTSGKSEKTYYTTTDQCHGVEGSKPIDAWRFICYISVGHSSTHTREYTWVVPHRRRSTLTVILTASEPHILDPSRGMFSS